MCEGFKSEKDKQVCNQKKSYDTFGAEGFTQSVPYVTAFVWPDVE